MDRKSYKSVLVYDISYQTLIAAKPLHIRFNKIDGYICVSDGTKIIQKN